MLYVNVRTIVYAVSLLLPWHIGATDTPQRPLGSPLQSESAAASNPHRVAIIGAGPGGSSAAYYLNRFAKSSEDGVPVPLEIDIFESHARIGGRTTTVNALDDARYPTELGASIFVQINQILFNATRDLDLTPTTTIYQTAPDAKYEIGVWDGHDFVFRAATDDDDSRGRWRGWWDIAKLLWKYGLSPIRTQRATRTAVAQFLQLYDPPLFPFPSLQNAVESTALDAYTHVSGTNILQQWSVGELFARDIVQASTRVNYASNLGGIHGLETLVCMATEGAMAVDGGNWHIFDEMVRASAAHVFLNTTVTHVIKDETQNTFSIRTRGASDNDDEDEDDNNNNSPPDRPSRQATDDDDDADDDLRTTYDSVVLAAPYQFADVAFSPPLANPPSPIAYNSLFVTLFTSPHRLAPSFFGLESPADVPSSLITTLPPHLHDPLSSRHGTAGVGPPGFWSISTMRVLHPNTDGLTSEPVNTSSDTQYLYKVFSPAPLTATFLAAILGIPSIPSDQTPPTDESLASLPKEHVTWIHEKHWYSYPHPTPRTTFDDFTLHTASSESVVDGAPQGLWYLSVMEPLISTMETSALAGMNVARLIVDGLSRDAQR